MICLQLLIPFAENKMWKLFLVRFRYCHCCVSVIIRPSGYFVSSHLDLGAIWVRDSCSRCCCIDHGYHHFKVLQRAT